MMPPLIVQDIGPVRTIKFNRPDKRNSLTLEMMAQLVDAVTNIPEEIRGVVLTAEGDHWSAGGDASTILHAMESSEEEDLMDRFHEAARALRACNRPVVATVFGAVYGGAFNLVLCTDLVLASTDARLCQVFLKRGVAPDVAGGYLLTRAIGRQKATELVLSAREIDATEAESLGLVARVFANKESMSEHAVALIEGFAAADAAAVAGSLRLLRAGESMGFGEFLDEEKRVQVQLLRSDGARAGFGEFLNRRETSRLS